CPQGSEALTGALPTATERPAREKGGLSSGDQRVVSKRRAGFSLLIGPGAGLGYVHHRVGQGNRVRPHGFARTRLGWGTGLRRTVGSRKPTVCSRGSLPRTRFSASDPARFGTSGFTSWTSMLVSRVHGQSGPATAISRALLCPI